MTEIRVDGLVFGYGGDVVLKDLTVAFGEPGLICVLGPNGVGKTTFVKCINRLLRPSSGTILIDGKDIQTAKLKDLAQFMAYVPNTESTVFSMTVSEYILMGRHPHSGWSTSERDLEIVDEAIDTLGLQEYADRNINELSAGQMQRVMIARGLAQEPRILILDEPTSNLDVKYQMGVMRFLRRYAREKGIVVLMVCHDLNITAAFADRVILMYDGRIFADGDARSVLTADNIRQVYDIGAEIVEIGGTMHIALLPEFDKE